MDTNDIKINITWKDQVMVVLLLLMMLPTFLKMGYEVAKANKN